jgi:tRNA(fMet)-specific endonuclease VapC
MSSAVYLLDTNAVIPMLNGDSAATKIINQSQRIYVPVIVLGELYFGAENSANVIANVKRVDEFMSRYAVLYCNNETARQYGKIESELRIKGIPIPQNDMWIAAIALQHGLTLLTKDAHFNDVDNLSVQGW